MPLMRTLLPRIVIGLLLVLAGSALLIALFDWNLLKPQINSRVSEQLGRPFAIQGELKVGWRLPQQGEGWQAWLPGLHASAANVQLGNPENLGGEYLARLEQLEVDFDPWALLWKTVRIPHITLHGLQASLLRQQDGHNNWTFSQDKAEEETPSSWTLDIGTLAFAQAEVQLDDQQLGTQAKLQIERLGEPLRFTEITGQGEPAEPTQDYAFAWTLQGRYQGMPLKGSGKLGGLLALHDPTVTFPLQADIQAGSSRIRLVGTLTDPRNLGSLSLRLQLSGTSLSHLEKFGVNLPQTSTFDTDGHLQARLHEAGGAYFHYQDFNGRIGQSDIHGDLTFIASQPRPKLSGTLVSNQLRFTDLAPLIGADDNAGKQARGESSRQPADRVLPAEPFETDSWRRMDAEVSFTGKRLIHSEQLPFSDLEVKLSLDDGVLSLSPLRFGVAGGQLQTHLHLDARQAPLRGKATLQARKLRLKQLFPSFAPLQTSFGYLSADAELSGQGQSVAALLGSASGNLKMLVSEGAVSRDLMEIAGLNIGNYVVGKLFGDKEVRINCAAADLGLDKGLLQTRLVLFDTENALVRVDGQVDLGKERLALDVIPEAKGVRLLSLRSPLYVQGTFKHPEAGVKVLPILARGAGAVALGVALAPAAGLLALVVPAEGEASGQGQCAGLFQRLEQQTRK